MQTFSFSTQGKQTYSSTDITSYLYQLPTRWLSQFNQQLGIWYDIACSYLTDELRVLSPEAYLPIDVQEALQAGRYPSVLIDSLQNQAACELEQFRMAIYVGLMQVINNDIEPSEWIHQLKQYESIIPNNRWKLLMAEVENFNDKYFMSVEQHAYSVYEVPAVAYQILFNRIENETSRKKENNSTKIKALHYDTQSKNYIVENAVLGHSKELLRWAYENPWQAFTLTIGLIAGANNFRSCLSMTENTLTSINWLSQVTVIYGTQQLFFARTHELSVLPVLASMLIPTEAQVNTTFFEIEKYFSYINTIQITSDGGIAVAGCEYNSLSYYNDLIIAKMYSNGTLDWMKSLSVGNGSSNAYALQETSDGGLVVTGYTDSVGAGYRDVLLAKWYGNGTLAWVQTLGESSSEVGYGIQETSDGGLVVTGYTDSVSTGYRDVLLAKWYGNGTFAWAQTLGSENYLVGKAIQKTFDGGLVVIGDFTIAGSNSVLLAKWYENGTLAWAKTLGASTYANYIEGMDALDVASDGSIVITGYTNMGGENILLAKLNSDGSLVTWAKAINFGSRSKGYAIQATHDGGVAIAGRYRVMESLILYTALMAKLDSSGTAMWAKALGSGELYDYQTGSQVLQETNEGSLVITGRISKDSFGLFLAKSTAQGNFFNCSFTNSIPFSSVNDLSGLSITYFNFTISNWSNPILQRWNITDNFVTTNLQQLCYQQYTVDPTDPTPTPIPSFSSSPSSIASPSPDHDSSSANRYTPALPSLGCSLLLLQYILSQIDNIILQSLNAIRSSGCRSIFFKSSFETKLPLFKFGSAKLANDNDDILFEQQPAENYSTITTNFLNCSY